MFDFDVKELPNIKFSHEQLTEYYYSIVENFQHLKWTPKNFDQQDHTVSELYSWAIQSNLTDTSKPCPPYDIKHDPDVIGTFDAPTEMLYGFGKIVVDTFPQVRQTVISAHPPSTVIQQHIDNHEFFKIHIPIKANNQSFFNFGNKKYNLEEGKAYFINTARTHGTSNEGNSDRIHFIFKIPFSQADEILKNEWILDPTQLDFDVIELDNIQFNYNELTQYYNWVKENFDYLKWTMPDIQNTNLKGLYGYGILTNKVNIDEACDPPGTRKDKKQYEPLIKPTKMLAGFAKKLLDKIPYMEELVITGHPPDTGIFPHADKDEHVRIHLPIQTTSESYFIIEEREYVLETQKAYAVNTKRIHTTINHGKTDRIHLHFKIPFGKINQFLDTDVNL